jgi:hypothetical protein
MDSTPISSQTWPARGVEATLRELRAEIVAIERTFPCSDMWEPYLK